MAAWANHMPPGMLLKSYPWASNLSDPLSKFTVKRFCAERAIPYHDEWMPLPVERFVDYGKVFQVQFVPQVERKVLISLEPGPAGLRARFDDGEEVEARRIVLAVGLQAFKKLPPAAERLSGLCSHSSEYGPLEALDGKEVVVVGGGSSASGLAALLHERSTQVSLVTRLPQLRFASRPRPRSLFEKMLAPTGGIGSGWTLGACSAFPQLIHALPFAKRAELANSRYLGPLGAAFMRDRVEGKLPIHLGQTLDRAESHNGRAVLHLVGADGSRRRMEADHVVFATGYRVDMSGLDFLDPSLLAGMRLLERAPELSRNYETSIPGLHVIGPASAYSFGPVGRFVYGVSHPARTLRRFLLKALACRQAIVSVPRPSDGMVLQS